jgi:hypothetical protein
MGVRQRTQEVADRLKCKTLEDRFRNEIVTGMNCSPFEAEAVLEVVREIYFPFLDASSPKMPPGRVSLVAICADEPAGKPVAECKKETVCLTVHRGEIDDQLLLQRATQFRRARLADLCQEALSQGALLTAEDLAYHIFFVSPRTISRDFAALRRNDPLVVIPLRSTVHDIGPVLTHRVRIVRLALEGKTTSQICEIMRHSPTAVANYLSTFTRVAQLKRKEMQAGQIAFLLRRGRSLIRQYLELLQECEQDKNMAYHLNEFLRLGNCGEGGKRTARRAGHG